MGSLLYDENELRMCNITTIKVQIESDAGRDAGQVSLQQLGAAVTANVDCLIMKDEGPTYMTFVTTYDPIPPPNQPSSGSQNFLDMNATHKASLYWGQSVMRMYWSEMLYRFYEENIQRKQPAYKTVVTLIRDTKKNTTAEEERDMDFLPVSACWMLHPNATGISHTYDHCVNHSISILAADDGSSAPVPSM